MKKMGIRITITQETDVASHFLFEIFDVKEVSDNEYDKKLDKLRTSTIESIIAFQDKGDNSNE